MKAPSELTTEVLLSRGFIRQEDWLENDTRHTIWWELTLPNGISIMFCEDEWYYSRYYSGPTEASRVEPPPEALADLEFLIQRLGREKRR